MADPAVVHAENKSVITRAGVLALSEELQESLPITGSRVNGLRSFHETEVPDRVRHLWRYSDPQSFMPNGSLLQPGSGRESVIRLTSELDSTPISVEPLSGSTRAADYLGRAVGADFGLFEALNAAAWSTGLVIHIPRGFVCSDPLHIGIDTRAESSISRLLVILEEGASATVVQHLGGGDASNSSDSAITNHVAELFVQPGAALDHLIVGELDDQSSAHLTVRAQVERDARYRQSVITLGGKNVKADLGADLIGQGANSEIYGVAIGDKRRVFDHHTVHRHAAEHTWSNIDFKTALSGRAKTAYTGLIRIDESADFSEAYQESRNLLLSDRCHADSIPELEILTNEVRCTHGATSSPIDQNELFYLQSRGIDRQNAARMIVQGFFGEIFTKAPASLRSEIEQLVERRLDSFQMGV